MAIDLSGYGQVGAALFVRLDIPDVGIVRMSNYHRAVAITESDGGSYVYDQLGILLSITDTQNELRATSHEVTVALSGIPVSYAVGIQQVRLKGSQIDIRRVFLDPVTDAVLAIAGNPVIAFRGVVNNYSFSETFNEFSDESTMSIAVTASSVVDVLQNKISGRRTNSEDMRKFYPQDTSFDRVTEIAGRAFNFGRPPDSQASSQDSREVRND